jgi:hypothetical protein
MKPSALPNCCLETMVNNPSTFPNYWLEMKINFLSSLLKCWLEMIVNYCTNTVPKIWQIFVGKEEEVPCRENFLVILGKQSSFPRITGKFSLQGTSSLIFSEICLVFGTVYPSATSSTSSAIKLKSSALVFFTTQEIGEKLSCSYYLFLPHTFSSLLIHLFAKLYVPTVCPFIFCLVFNVLFSIFLYFFLQR